MGCGSASGEAAIAIIVKIERGYILSGLDLGWMYF